MEGQHLISSNLLKFSSTKIQNCCNVKNYKTANKEILKYKNKELEALK